MSTKEKRFVVSAPCAKCPFRKDVPIYLRPGRRREIAESLLKGGEFACHETTVQSLTDPEEMLATEESLMCAGAAKALLKVGIANQMMRVMERLGGADWEKIESRGAEVWDIYEWQRQEEGSTGDAPVEEEEILTCSVVDDGCEAPAGYLSGDGVVLGDEAAEFECPGCGEPVCGNCRDETTGLCNHCKEWEDDE